MSTMAIADAKSKSRIVINQVGRNTQSLIRKKMHRGRIENIWWIRDNDFLNREYVITFPGNTGMVLNMNAIPFVSDERLYSRRAFNMAMKNGQIMTEDIIENEQRYEEEGAISNQEEVVVTLNANKMRNDGENWEIYVA